LDHFFAGRDHHVSRKRLDSKFSRQLRVLVNVNPHRDNRLVQLPNHGWIAKDKGLDFLARAAPTRSKVQEDWLPTLGRLGLGGGQVGGPLNLLSRRSGGENRERRKASDSIPVHAANVHDGTIPSSEPEVSRYGLVSVCVAGKV
jgi:hypothetical protein